MLQRAALLAGLTALGLLAAPAMALELSADADPAVREIVSACSDAVASKTVPTTGGWQQSQPSGPETLGELPDTLYAQRMLDGVGQLYLRLASEVSNGSRVSHCSVSVIDPQRPLPVADFGKADGLVATSGGDVQSVWFSADNKLIVTVIPRTNPDGLLFLLDVVADAVL
jgi:hypothetical protein